MVNLNPIPYLKEASPKKRWIIILGIVFALVISLAFILAVFFSDQFRSRFSQQREQEFAAPGEAVREEVKRITLKRRGEQGEETIEILPNGQINVYDANGRLIRTSLLGFANTNNLFEDIARNLDQFKQTGTKSGDGNYELTIETNKGTTTVVVTDDGDETNDDDDDIIDDTIDDIEDIEDDTFSPTPTPNTQTPPPGGSPSPDPTPGPTWTPAPTLPPGASPTPVPSGTPIPDYLLAPPFECGDYYTGGKPIHISQTTCGFDPETPQ